MSETKNSEVVAGVVAKQELVLPSGRKVTVTLPERLGAVRVSRVDPDREARAIGLYAWLERIVMTLTAKGQATTVQAVYDHAYEVADTSPNKVWLDYPPNERYWMSRYIAERTASRGGVERIKSGGRVFFVGRA